MVTWFLVLWGCCGWAAACIFISLWGARKHAMEGVPSIAHNSAMPKLLSLKEVLSQSGNMQGLLSGNEREAVIRAYHIISQQLSA